MFGDDYYLELQRHRVTNPHQRANRETYPLQVRANKALMELAEEYGSVKDVANRFGVNAIYLQRLADDSKASPSEELLMKLGLQRIPLYVRKT